MKTLSPTLLAAQKSASARPFVKALIRDYYGDNPRLRFQRWYTGVEAAAPAACVAAADGALVHVRNDAGTLYASRVATPGPGSTFSSWAAVETVFAGSGVALVRMPSNELWLFYVESNHTTIEVMVSADGGATWGLGAAIVTAGGNKDHLAADVSGAGDVVLFWNEGATVYTSRWSGGAWTAHRLDRAHRLVPRGGFDNGPCRAR